MKTQKRLFTSMILLVIMTFSIWGCKLTSILPVKKSETAVMADPLIGLDALQTYHISFQQDATGSVDGQPYEYHNQVEMSRLPGKLDFTRRLAGTEEPSSFLHLISDGQAVYRWADPDQPCQGEIGNLPVDEILDPSSFLIPVSSATKIGSETMNQIQTTHYTFDQNGLNISTPKPDVVGELWIADQGGFVVKMSLSMAPPAKTTGKGKEISQNWTYEISQVNSIDAITLPQGCKPVPSEIPVMPDAQETNFASGMLSYITNSQAADVVDLYFNSLPGLGWQTDQKNPGSDLVLPVSLMFKKGDQKLTINIDISAQSGLDVNVLINSISQASTTFATSTPAEELPTGPAPTLNADESGLPADIPLYPGVTADITMQNVLMVNSSDPLDNVVNFYLEKMPGLDWELQNNVVSEGTTILIWQKDDRMVSITIMPDNDRTKLVISQNE